MLELLAYIPLFPLAGFLVNALVGRLLPRRAVGWIASLAVAASFVVSVGCVAELASGMPGRTRIVERVYTWAATGDLTAGVSFLLDPLSAVMLLVVTGIGLLIHIYSTGYMAHEEGFARYFAYLNLFVFFMLLLVMGNNFLVMFVGWEGVGLCSYLLIGFYYDKEFAAAAGKKAFIVNRIGDFGFLLAVLLAFAAFGTLEFFDGGHGLLDRGAIPMAIATPIALLLFLGACGKSAQLPLYVWLPDAMAGPTPVSALIHAATMVTAGIYMMARCNAIFSVSPIALAVVASIGGLTALFAASIAVAQTDIKKVLAYSTVSQLGYMALAVGSGAYAAAVFHLVTHAFFKALLFLGSGSVIHAMGGEQDIRKMGGLREHLPVTWRTFAIGWLAIAGVPGLAGFFSKDLILEKVFENGGPLYLALWGMAILTALLTAFYMTRLVALTFLGEFRGTHDQEHHLHESPASMTGPLVLLAGGSIAAGWIGVPALMSFGYDMDLWGRWLAPVFESPAAHGAAAHGAAAHHLSPAIAWALVAASVAAALAGIWWGLAWYGRRAHGQPERAAAAFPSLWRLVADKYRVDELYQRAVVSPLRALGTGLWKIADVLVIDGIVNATALITEIVGDLLRFLQTGNVRNYALSFVGGVLVMLWLVL